MRKNCALKFTAFPFEFQFYEMGEKEIILLRNPLDEKIWHECASVRKPFTLPVIPTYDRKVANKFSTFLISFQ